MSEKTSLLTTAITKDQEQTIGLIEKLFTVAQPEAVYGKPIEVGDKVIFTASEVSVGMGVGFGFGGEFESEEDVESGEGAELGSGGGGGGGAQGRPVAVVSVGPDGVEVEPVVDATKIALAFFTMLGSIFLMGAKMKKKSKA